MVVATNNSIAAAELALHDNSFSNDHGGAALCCFCDEPLPSVPSDELVDMRKVLEDETWADLSPSNPGRRDAERWRVYYEYCERHHFEAEDLPRAIEECWPRKIDFALLHERILMFRQPLKGEYAAFKGTRTG
jgi:hypothetical protein